MKVTAFFSYCIKKLRDAKLTDYSREVLCKVQCSKVVETSHLGYGREMTFAEPHYGPQSCLTHAIALNLPNNATEYMII